MREFTLYLPIYNDLVSLEIGLDPSAKILSPSPFRLAKPVVVYGTSITQGGCASRGANGWVPLVGRMLGVDIVNLGFSGNGKSGLEVADLMTEIDAACYINDCVGNMTLDDMKARYAAFHSRIRAKRSDTPILLMTTIRYGGEGQLPGRAAHWEMMRAFVMKTHQRFRQCGDRNIHSFDCRKLNGFERNHPSVDGSHLTDLGFKLLADGVAPVLRKILNIR
jgi:lysophospholipase L1-like esterase